MRTIWKYPLDVVTVQRIEIRRGAEILCVQMQGIAPTLWVRLNPDEAAESRTIFIHGTGDKVGERAGRYIGTFQLEGGALVFHVFEHVHL